MCYHAEFGRSALKSVGINTEKPLRLPPRRFLTGCRKRRLNQALSVLSLSLDFLSVCLLTRAICVVLCHLCVLWNFCLLVVLVRLSVPVHVIDWKDTSPK